MSETLELWDYRRRVASIYEEVRRMGTGPESWKRWRDSRDRLFASHPQTPIEDTSDFVGLPYFKYDPGLATRGTFEANPSQRWGEFSRVGQVSFELRDEPFRLPFFWLDAYGGGLFLPFKDRTSGSSTYGGGRYLLDTVKGADLGHTGEEIVLDFNFAYHPSCVHSDRWTCPLAPLDAVLDLEVTAGERLQ